MRQRNDLHPEVSPPVKQDEDEPESSTGSRAKKRAEPRRSAPSDRLFVCGVNK